MKLSVRRFALVIGSVSTLGPISIDMYLPGLPALAQELHASAGQAELTLTSYFVGSTLGQLLYGPLSDRVGRRPPMLVGLVLFTLAGLACSFAPNLEVLTLARLFQGLGSAGVWVIGSAVIRDMYSGYEAARLQATRMLVIAVSPILAPVMGAAIIVAGNWRWIFWITSILGVAGFMMILSMLPETRSAEARRETRLLASFAVYRRLAVDWSLVRLMLIIGLVQGTFLAYLAGSAFVFITMNHAAPTLYSLMFALNAGGFIGLAQFSPQLMRRFGAERLIVTGTSVLAIAGVMLLVAALCGYATIPVLAPILFFGIAGVGLVLGPATVLALREHGSVAGAASSLIGFVQGCLGATGTALVSVFANGAATPMTGTMAVFAVTASLIAMEVFRRSRRAAQPAPVGG